MTRVQKLARGLRISSDIGTHLLMVSVPALYAIAFTTPFVGMVMAIDPLL